MPRTTKLNETRKTSVPPSSIEKIAANLARQAGSRSKSPSTRDILNIRKQLAQKPPSVPKKTDFAKRAPRIAQVIPSAPAAGAGSMLTNIGLSDLAYTIFGKKYIDELITTKIIDTPRDIWELSTPTTQCENLIGKATGETRCWICNLQLGSQEGLTPECEHVLPIAQAVLYLGLFSVSAAKKIFPSEMFVLPGEKSDALKLEYRWAHRVCNQIKNDDSYLDYNSTTGQYIVREDKIKDLLKRIKTNTRSYGAAIKPLLVDLSGGSAIQVFQEVCKYLNSYGAPSLLEFAGLISAGYGPRKVGVNRDLTPISKEERDANIRREIIKANIEYSGLIQKTWEKLASAPRLNTLGEKVNTVFFRIVENRRPEYVSLFMRIKPTQKNMNHLVAYIRQQLFSEFASVNAEVELGIPPSGRKTASDIFKSVIAPIIESITVSPSPEFNEELLNANKLYQNDTSIGDTIRTVLSEYLREELSPAVKAACQADLSNELIETSGESDPIDPSSDYAKILIDMASIHTTALSDAGTVASDPSGPWVDNIDKLVDLLNSTEQWTAEETGAVGILKGLSNLSPVNFNGGRRLHSRRRKRTRKLRRRV